LEGGIGLSEGVDIVRDFPALDFHLIFFGGGLNNRDSIFSDEAIKLFTLDMGYRSGFFSGSFFLSLNSRYFPGSAMKKSNKPTMAKAKRRRPE